MRPEDQPGVEAPIGETAVREWRIEQLERLGLGRIVAELFAPEVDWHELEGLLSRGCRLDLALRISR